MPQPLYIIVLNQVYIDNLDLVISGIDIEAKNLVFKKLVQYPDSDLDIADPEILLDTIIGNAGNNSTNNNTDVNNDTINTNIDSYHLIRIELGERESGHLLQIYRCLY